VAAQKRTMVSRYRRAFRYARTAIAVQLAKVAAPRPDGYRAPVANRWSWRSSGRTATAGRSGC